MAKPGSDVMVANHHTGMIILPRVYEVNMSGDPTRNKVLFSERQIPAGEAVPVPSVEWVYRKEKGSLVAIMLDKGILSVARKAGEVDFRMQSTSDLNIPEHLRAESHEGQSSVDGSRVSAALDKKRTKTGTVII